MLQTIALPEPLKLKSSRARGEIVYPGSGKEPLGCLVYVLRGKGEIEATHTFVAEEARGQGVGKVLISGLLALCEAERRVVIPTCSYVARLIAREPKGKCYLDHAEVGEALWKPFPKKLWERATVVDPSVPYAQTWERVLSIAQDMRAMSTPEGIATSSRYFRTGLGEYAEGDKFLGISASSYNSLLKVAAPWSLPAIWMLIYSPFHEERCLGLKMWEKRMLSAATPEERAEHFRLYIAHARQSNNWDLVDVVAPTFVGFYMQDLAPAEQVRELLALSQSDNLWQVRIAVVGSWGLIRKGIYKPTLELVLALRRHPHDLIHKAMGWMLREVGKRVDEHILLSFLDDYATTLPRTTLRYAVERLGPDLRAYYIKLPRR